MDLMIINCKRTYTHPKHESKYMVEDDASSLETDENVSELDSYLNDLGLQIFLFKDCWIMNIESPGYIDFDFWMSNILLLINFKKTNNLKLPWVDL